MEIITQTLLTLTITELLKDWGIELMIIILFAILLFWINRKKKLTKLEIILAAFIVIQYVFNLSVLNAIDDYKNLAKTQKEVIEKQETIIEDYRTAAKNFSVKLNTLETDLTIKNEIKTLLLNLNE